MYSVFFFPSIPLFLPFIPCYFSLFSYRFSNTELITFPHTIKLNFSQKQQLVNLPALSSTPLPFFLLQFARLHT